MTLFSTLFRTKKTPESLPLSSRVATLEGELLAMRATVEALHAVTKRVQGKVYKSISMGEIEDVSKEAPAPEPAHQPTRGSKADLYAAAARLRTH